MKLESAASTFVRELNDFFYGLSVLDHVWNVRFPGRQGKWHHLHVNKYRETFYITDIAGECECLEVEPGKFVRAADPMGSRSREWAEGTDLLSETWERLIADARRWLCVVRRDWIRANRRVQTGYPLRFRYGIVPNALVRSSLPDVYRPDKELGKARTRKLIRLVEQGFFMREENTVRASMTAADYFQYCRIAYLAAKRKEETVDASLSGRDLYARYADGRHEGLLDIDPGSAQEFGDWIDGVHPKKGGGGHPWEIKRGGNTTHIDLSVFRPSPYRKEGFKVELRGESIGRLVETMRMFLAIHEAGLPISIANSEGVRKRLLAQDNIGIIPAYASPHRANQHFKEHEDVFDVMHYDDLGRFKRRLRPFIRWEPLLILQPMGSTPNQGQTTARGAGVVPQAVRCGGNPAPPVL
jgi:hypothetical protein